MKNYEISIELKNSSYKDSLITALVNQGYNVYMSYDSFEVGGVQTICFNATDEDVFLVNEQ